ncbi:hypothetical protein TVAG_119200 [Trichomonas vaginalis G3]|uniref:Uncharacterized protein n=1 Tax=Trichomonas vaginalis (strain ATCC PRA-98 / G3) TaxID=412133 RepID=A2D767_TRIV3|nr:cilia- and flagella-associated protein 58-related family [Trichomonas vaginalis G3]EAY23584.1 hypothetical protein TVAG_119200 [Trichomonas vaginalis G3]KAI5490081.1 cilia- and flagella-associated protein 58-related family [Trichomonas vaginalis G3]|eukprot:XP_001276832.1 hypothetical protein [Trichomonas vaginalis G3]
MSKDPGKEDLADQDSFLEIEKNFHQVINEIVQDKSLEKFRNSYEELHNALILSQEHNKSLVEKCSALNNDILQNAEKIAQVLKLSQEDQTTINNLRNEFERAWEIVSKSEENDRRTVIIIENLKAETFRLSNLVEQTKNFTATREVSEQDVTSDIEKIRAEIKKNNEDMENMRKQIESMRTEGVSLVKEASKTKEELDLVQEDLNQLNSTISNNEDVFNSTNSEAKVIHEQIQALTDKYKQNINQIKESQERIAQNQEVKRKLLMDQDNTDYERFLIHKKIHRGKINLRMTKKKNDDYNKLIKAQQGYYDRQEMIASTFPADLKLLNKEKEDLLNDQKEITKYHSEIQNVKNEYQNAIQQNRDIIQQAKTVKNSLSMSIKAKQLTADKQQFIVGNLEEDLEKSKYQQNSESERIRKAELDKLKLKQENFNDETYGSNLEDEAFRFKSKAALDRKNGAALAANNAVRNKQIDENTKNYKILGNQISNLSSQNQSISGECHRLESTLTQMNRDQENILSDMHLKREEVYRYKNIINDIDVKIADEHLIRLKTENENNELESEIEKLNSDIEEQNQRIQNLMEEKDQKRMIFDMAQTSIEELKRELNQINNIIRSLHLQIYNVEKPLFVVREDVVLKKAALNNKYKLYSDKSQEIQDLKANLQREVEKQQLLQWKSLESINMKKEFVKMESELEYNKKLSSAMENELEKPRFVHSVSMMESTDPEKYALIRMKHQIIEESWNKSRFCEKLKKQVKDLKKEYERLVKHVYNSRIDPHTEMDTLNQQLRTKTVHLMNMDQKYQDDKNNLIERESEVISARDQLRNEKIMNSQMSYKMSRADTLQTPKLPPLKLPRVETLFIGGGFALASPHVPTVAPAPFSARLKMNRKLLPKKNPTTPRGNNFTPKAQIVKPYVIESPVFT